jgi:hypothetical protein
MREKEKKHIEKREWRSENAMGRWTGICDVKIIESNLGSRKNEQLNRL